jgi:hypothetical protein
MLFGLYSVLYAKRIVTDDFENPIFASTQYTGLVGLYTFVCHWLPLPILDSWRLEVHRAPSLYEFALILCNGFLSSSCIKSV